MTVFDATLMLYNWFNENDVFCMKDNFQQAVLLTENESHDKASIQAALGQLEEGGIIAKQDSEGKTYYVLNQRLDTLEQDLKIHHTTATKISQKINYFCERISDFQDICDPSDIKQRDLINLTLIIDYFIDKENEEND